MTGLKPLPTRLEMPRPRNEASRSWRERSACGPQLGDVMNPAGEKGHHVTEVARAKAVCRDCPVWRECLEWAIASGSTGIWGGTTVHERKKIARKRANPQVEDQQGH